MTNPIREVKKKLREVEMMLQTAGSKVSEILVELERLQTRSRKY